MRYTANSLRYKLARILHSISCGISPLGAQTVNVRILIGSSAYAVIRADDGRTLDVRLSPGRSAPTSLRESAQEWRERAARLVERATIAERAADALSEEG